MDVGFRVFVGQEQKLGHDEVGHLVANAFAHKDNSVFQKARVDVVGAFAPTGRLDHDGNQGVVGAHFFFSGTWKTSSTRP